MRKLALLIVLALMVSACAGALADNEFETPDDMFVGVWADDRCSLEITNLVGDEDTNTALRYSIVAIWGNTYDTEVTYVMTGDFEPDSNSLVYTDGTKSILTFDENGEVTNEEVCWEDGKGTLTLNEDNALVWNDENDEAVTDKTFTYVDLSAKTIAPLPYDLNMTAIPDGEYAAAFDPATFSTDGEDVFLNVVEIYTADLYDAAEINDMDIGDTIVVGEELYDVNLLEYWDDGVVAVNGGLEEGGCSLYPGEGGTYAIRMWDDYTTYTMQGATWFALDKDATFTDATSLDSDPVTYAYADIAEAVAAKEDYTFDQYTTVITVTDGKITNITLNYVP